MDIDVAKQIVQKIAGKQWKEALLSVDELYNSEPKESLLDIKKAIQFLKSEEYPSAKALLNKMEDCDIARGIFHVYEHIFTSQDMTVNEVSPGADTSKILREDTNYTEDTEKTMYDSNVEEPNPWDLESQALTQVISDSLSSPSLASSSNVLNEPSRFMDASTITRANKIGPYENLVEIGRGGMGVVYKAYDTQNNRYVALKTIKEDDVPEEIKERFVREMDIVSKLDHPNIIRVYDKFFYDDRMFFSMEFINGHTLKDLQDAKRPFPLEEILEIVLKICDALEHAHGKGIIHRDLKPSNIMLDINNHVKVVDFGIAKKMGEEKYTRTGQVVGSIQYMPPEQMNGNIKDIDERSDVYTIGAILYEMIMGMPPFPTPKIKNEMPKTLKNICLKCLCEQKQGRYQNVSILKKDLGAFSRNLSETKSQKTYKWLSRVAVTIIVFGLAGYSYFISKDKNSYKDLLEKQSTEVSFLKEKLQTKQNDELFLQANICRLEGQYTKAVELYTKVLAEDNNYTDAYINRGLSYKKQKEYLKAIDDFVVALKEKDKADIYYYCGQAYHLLKDYPNAIEYYQKAVLKEDHRDSLFALAQVHYQKESLQESSKYLERVFELDKLNTALNLREAEKYYLQADIHLKKQEYLKAVKNLIFGYCISPDSIKQKQKVILEDALQNEAFFTRTLVLFDYVYPQAGREHLEANLEKSDFFYAAIGFLYEKEKNYSLAKEWYERGDEISKAWTYRLARLYLEGLGVKQNQQKAREMFENLTRYNTTAMVYLGYMYREGIGTSLNFDVSFSWFKKAAELNNFDAMAEMGTMVFVGRGTTKNQAIGVEWLEKAAQNGSTKALVTLAKLYEKGIYVMQDKEKVQQLLENARQIEKYYSTE